ncbi:MAG TPA: glycosyl hydrolase [Gemmatimonadaceae bacterium]|nr:glycosyl hydrolase [Gemmatimonadaceae bacterium]
MPLLVVALAIHPVSAPGAQTPAVAASAATAEFDTTLLAQLRWRELGPARGGRSVAVAGSVQRSNEYWMGTTGGGVFKTTDGGTTWVPVSDGFFGGTIGAIAVAASNADIVYVGTGEFPIRGNVSHGDGVYKTTDGGRTWTHLGLTETRQISRVIVHPRDPDVVWVGAQGQVWGPNPERGVYKTADGGRTWDRILFRNDSTGITDLEIDPTDPDVLYAGFWQVHRKPWQLVSGGAGSGLLKSTDGGRTWTELTRNPGLPQDLWGNVGIAVSPVLPNRVWAIIEADSGGVFRSDDGGLTWTKLNEERRLRQRAWYYTRIYADTRDTNTVYVSNVQFLRSRDGGRTWQVIRTQHADSHDLWIAPDDPQRIIEGNDGGANITVNGGQTWTHQNYPTAQFYHVHVTNHFPYHVCGAQQDNSTFCGPSAGPGAWYAVGGGESGYIFSRPDDPDIFFAGSYGGLLTRRDMRTGLTRNIHAWPDNPMGHSAGDLRHRFQWTFPIVGSPHDPNVVYISSQHVMRTSNEGESWEIISPDLTRNDPRTMGPSGGPITRDQTSVEYYGTVFTLAESPLKQGVIWTGSDDGRIHVTRDGARTWQNVTPRGIPEWMRMSIIEPSPHDTATAYVAGNRFQMNDMQPYLYRTTDYGRTWTRIDGGIARDEFTRVIRADPVRPGLLYAGTERGVWVSFDDGARWQRLRMNLPPVPVHDLAIKGSDLVAGTHGRSFWIFGELPLLRQLTADVVAADVHLFTPPDSYRAGGGVQVAYHLRDPTGPVKIDFLDERGTIVRSYSSALDSAALADSIAGTFTPGPRPGARRGVNTFTWNTRYADAASFRGIIMWAANTLGPMAPPGTYSVRLTTADGKSETQEFRLLGHPKSTATQAELDQQFGFLLQIRDTLSAANNAVRTIRNVKAQLDDRADRMPANRRTAFRQLATQFSQRLSVVEDSIYQTRNQSGQDPLNYPIRLNNKIAALMGVVGSTDARPTTQSYEVYRMLTARLHGELTALDRLMRDMLPRVNQQLRQTGLPEIVPGTEEIRRPGAVANGSRGQSR